MPDSTFVLGYATPLEAFAGERIQFHLSSDQVTSARAQVVRVRCGDPDPAGPGIQLVDVEALAPRDVALKHQPIQAGSCAVVPVGTALDGLAAFTLGAWIWPTTPGASRQTLMARWSAASGRGWELALDEEGCLEFIVCDGVRRASVRQAEPLRQREWRFVGASFEAASGRIAVFQRGLSSGQGVDSGDAFSSEVASQGPQGLLPSVDAAVPIRLAALPTDDTGRRTRQHFSGKIDSPFLLRGVHQAQALRALQGGEAWPLSGEAGEACVAVWDFADGIGGDGFADRGPLGLHGHLVNTPTRAVTGPHWSGRRHHWSQAPEEYGAIHFHDDDIDDCGWDATLSVDLPDDLPSGFYSLRLTAAGTGTLPGQQPRESHVGFFVSARPGRPTARIAFLAPTATFLAYSNSAMRLDLAGSEAMQEQLLVIGPDELYLQEHRELGTSTYDTHSDGSGVCHVSGARPILNMRPYGGGYYSMETRVLDWLDHTGLAYDVITDEMLHRHGLSLLQGYTCVVTGAHPEYHSAAMLDALEAFQQRGGRHLYLGGNGFYWRVGLRADKVSRLEIRRGMSGTRTWEGEPGENGLASTDEPSGLWRSSGRAPQRLVGVGFAAQVFDRGAGYRRLPDSFDPRAAFIFDGIGADEPIGWFGLRGGAAGHEVDRVEQRLGSPAHLLRVATADDLGSGALATPEEIAFGNRGVGGDLNAQVRADMVFFETAGGGAVFATGSIAWAMALSHAGYDNNVCRITGNVLRRFADPAPFDLPGSAPAAAGV